MDLSPTNPPAATAGAPVAASGFRAGLPARARAVALHVALSAIAFAVALYFVLVRWYPGFHFFVDGGWQGLRLLAPLFFAAGPLLTAMIFNPFKSRRAIRFDLACIGIVQVAVLAWGLYALHRQHPVAVSFQGGMFHGVVAEPLRVESYPLERLATLSSEAPPVVFVAPASNPDEETRVAMQEMVHGTADYEDPFFFRPFAEHWSDVSATGRDLARQRTIDGEALTAFAAKFGDASRWRFFGYEGRYGTCTVAFTADGRIVGGFGCKPF